MKASVFCDDDQEPVVIDLSTDSGMGEDGEPHSLADLFGDIGLGVEELHIVSEQALNVALHALHGALRALNGGPGYAGDWLTAGLRELAFYDRDGVQTEGELDAPGGCRAADPGREGLTGYVEWPGV